MGAEKPSFAIGRRRRRFLRWHVRQCLPCEFWVNWLLSQNVGHELTRGQSGQARPNQPMTYLEQKRAQAQKMYQEEQKYWADNAEEFKKWVPASSSGSGLEPWDWGWGWC